MKKKILVVDDEGEYEIIFKTVLERAGFDVEGCRFAGNVFERVAEGSIDLVLLDYVMPDQKGDVVCRTIRGLEKLKSLPIIIVTGHHDLEEVFLLSLGANEVIYKPVDSKELVEKVEKYLGKNLV